MIQRTTLGLEAMDGRIVPAALSYGAQPTGDTFVYTETNNPNDGQNAVLQFRRDARTGDLTQVGKFATGGTGQANNPKAVGIDDGDQQVRATADGKFLFAVNQGSDSVSAFRVLGNGRLQLIGNFASGGDQPDTVGIAGNVLYVGNAGNAAAGSPGTTAPSVTAFNIGRDGTLTAIPSATVTFPVGTRVTQTLVSADGRFLFVEAASFQGTAGGNTVNTFRINADGTLTAAPGGAASAGATAPVLLGAAQNPRYNIVYTGFASSGQVGVFTYDETGRTTFVTAAADTGAAPCWCVVSADGKLLYVANTVSDSVTVYSLLDPLRPVEIQELKLGGPRGTAATGQAFVFEIALDPTGRSLYAVTQSTDPRFPQGNQLHILNVARDGALSETVAPIIFSTNDVPANAHPQGLAVVTLGRNAGIDGRDTADADDRFRELFSRFRFGRRG